MIIISIILIILAGLAKAAMDYENDSGGKSKSWMNKYAQPMQILSEQPWYYFGLIHVMYKEKFMFSSTLFAWTTDIWHFAQRIFLTSLYYVISISFCRAFDLNWAWLNTIALVILPSILGIPFEVYYGILKRTNR